VHHVGILCDQFMMHGQRNIKVVGSFLWLAHSYLSFLPELFVASLSFLCQGTCISWRVNDYTTKQDDRRCCFLTTYCLWCIRELFSLERWTLCFVHDECGMKIQLTDWLNHLLTYILTHSIEQNASWEANRSLTSLEIPCIFVEPDGPLL